MALPHLRTTQSGTVDVGMAYPRWWEFYVDDEPHDLTQYDSLNVLVYDSTNTKVDEAAMTVSAVTNPDSSGAPVQNRGDYTLIPAQSAGAGDYFAHAVGFKAGQPYQLGQPIKMEYFPEPPTV